MMQKTKEKEAQKELRSIANTPTNMGCMRLCELLPATLFHYEVISVSRLALDTPGTGSEGFPAVEAGRQSWASLSTEHSAGHFSQNVSARF